MLPAPPTTTHPTLLSAHVASAPSSDFPEFYTKLYALVEPDVIASKHRDEFFFLANQFLQSAFIPASTAASFAKKLSRLSLEAPPAALLVLMPFCYNVMAYHKPTRVLMNMPRKDKAAQPWTDPFDEHERDPAKTHALDSCLWELRVHSTHFVPAVANVAAMFQKRQTFDQPLYGIDDFAGAAYQSLFDMELARKVKGVALEYRVTDTPFAHLEHAWTLPPLLGAGDRAGSGDGDGDGEAAAAAL